MVMMMMMTVMTVMMVMMVGRWRRSWRWWHWWYWWRWWRWIGGWWGGWSCWWRSFLSLLLWQLLDTLQNGQLTGDILPSIVKKSYRTTYHIISYIYIYAYAISYSHQTISNYPSHSKINDSWISISSRPAEALSGPRSCHFLSAVQPSRSHGPKNLGDPSEPQLRSSHQKSLGKPWKSVKSGSYLNILRNQNMSETWRSVFLVYSESAIKGRSFGVAIPATTLGTFYLYQNLSSARLFN